MEDAWSDTPSVAKARGNKRPSADGKPSYQSSTVRIRFVASIHSPDNARPRNRKACYPCKRGHATWIDHATLHCQKSARPTDSQDNGTYKDLQISSHGWDTPLRLIYLGLLDLDKLSNPSRVRVSCIPISREPASVLLSKPSWRALRNSQTLRRVLSPPHLDSRRMPQVASNP